MTPRQNSASFYTLTYFFQWVLHLLAICANKIWPEKGKREKEETEKKEKGKGGKTEGRETEELWQYIHQNIKSSYISSWRKYK